MEVRTRFDDVNACLGVTCDDEGVAFVDNRNYFHLIDSYYQQYGTHLITKATNKLIPNLLADTEGRRT